MWIGRPSQLSLCASLVGLSCIWHRFGMHFRTHVLVPTASLTGRRWIMIYPGRRLSVMWFAQRSCLYRINVMCFVFLASLSANMLRKFSFHSYACKYVAKQSRNRCATLLRSCRCRGSFANLLLDRSESSAKRFAKLLRKRCESYLYVLVQTCCESHEIVPKLPRNES